MPPVVVELESGRTKIVLLTGIYPYGGGVDCTENPWLIVPALFLDGYFSMKQELLM